ncbi:MAG: sialidase family protein, partial [Bacteroidota bacterium]
MNLAQRALFIPLIFSFFFLISCSNNLWAQEEEQELPPISALYQELQEDDFLPVDRASMPTSPAFRGANDLFFFTQVNTNDNGDNILGDAANEPSMAIDPNNPDRMMMGWRQFDTVNSNFRQAGFAYSNDGGDTWTFPGVINPGVFRSDPVLSVDSDGNFHYNSLSSDTIGSFFCTQFTSTGDDTWSDGTPAKGGDKQWMTIDRSGGDGDGHIYTNWNSGLSFCPPFDFSRSVDNNLSFEDCSSIPDAPFWGTLAVGPTGELFSCGFSGNFFGELSIARSDNAQNANEPLIWNQVTSTSLGGNPVAFGGQDTPNPVGLHGQAWVDVDRSGGPSNGHVYALAAVEVFDNFPDPSDVMFIRSTDGGQTFSTPIKINDDDEAANNWQWMAAMSVAP